MHRTPLRRVSQGSLAGIGRSNNYSDAPTGLGFIVPALNELADEMEALHANTLGLNELSDALDKFNEENVKIPELGVLWGSTLVFTLVVWYGGRFSRWVGAAMLLCYIAFIVLEFTIIHSVN